ncbi:MAG: c-type cytochrome [Nitrospirae bacterium]|nr:MAG: c-type cytochrome [Nitrospirota bacterium]
MSNRRNLFIIAGLALAGLAVVVLFFDLPEGSEIFKREGCISCHSFKGSGGSAGPELTSVTSRRTDPWIRRQITDPKSHNPSSAMPSFRHLSRKEVTALIRYLKS